MKKERAKGNNLFQIPDVNGHTFTNERLGNGNMGLFAFLAFNNNHKHSINDNGSCLPSTL